MFFVLLVTFLSLTSQIIPLEAVVYVSTTGSDLNDGSSWQTAFATLGAALRTSDNTINVGEGNFTVPPNQINRTLSVFGRGSQLTFFRGSAFKAINIGTVPYVRIVDVGYKREPLQIGYVPPGTSMAFENVEVISCASLNGNGLFQSDGGSLTFDNVSVRGTFPNGEASVIYAPWGDITIRNSVFYKNPNIAVINGNFFSNKTIYSGNRGVLNARSASVLTLYNNEFYSNYWDSTINTFVCQTGVSYGDVSGNTYCGANALIFSCPSFPKSSDLQLLVHDGCGRCGVTTNLDKDCNGTCFARTPAANCVPRKTLYAAPNGTDTNDGLAFWRPLPIQVAVARAFYKDTIMAMPGTYFFPKMGTPFGFQGKAITIRSYLDDPTTVTFRGLADSFTPLLNVSQGESFDSVLQAVTLYIGSPNIHVSGDSALSVVNCILDTGLSPRAGGVTVRNDGAIDIKSTSFISNQGSMPGSPSAMWVESELNHYSWVNIAGSRFYNNLGNSAGTIRVLTWSYVYIGTSWFDSNRASNVATLAAALSEISVESETSTFGSTTLSFRDTLSQGLARVYTCANSFNNFSTSASAIYICPTNISLPTMSTCSPTKVNLGNINRAYSDCGGCAYQRPGLKDCLGQCWGYASVDSAGTCCTNAAKDCNGICNGPAGYDNQWICQPNKTLIDCAGVYNGTAVKDCNGICNGLAKLDCNGTCNGSCIKDNFGGCCLPSQTVNSRCFGSSSSSSSSSSIPTSSSTSSIPTSSSSSSSIPTSSSTSGSPTSSSSTDGSSSSTQ